MSVKGCVGGFYLGGPWGLDDDSAFSYPDSWYPDDVTAASGAAGAHP